MKNILKNIIEERIKINYKTSISMLLLSAVIITFLMFLIQPLEFEKFLFHLQYDPTFFYLNLFPILICMSVVFLLTNNIVFTTILSGTFFIVIAIVNNMKMSMRQMPLLPSDFALLKELSVVVDMYLKNYEGLIKAATIIVLVLLFMSLFFFKSKQFKFIYRLPLIIIITLVSYIGISTTYADEFLYNSFLYDGNPKFKSSHFVSKGLAYSFIYELKATDIKEPDNYNITGIKEVAGIENENSIEELRAAEKPHIIAIMGETYTDLIENENINYDGYEDFVDNLNIIKNDSNTVVSGHTIVPSYGGGTADSEFDFLTACPTVFMSSEKVSYDFLTKNTDSLVNVLENIGYESTAIHPGDSWFYKRSTVYDYFGFDDFYYLGKPFDIEKDSKGDFISEEAVTRKIIADFVNHTQQSDNPLFQFTVTIQNHGPYIDKYEGVATNFNTDIKLTLDEKNMLSNYFSGINDANNQIRDLITYFKYSEEPVVLVYFGDHLPTFPNSFELFQKLEYGIDPNGTINERLDVYKTPFFIWQNDSAKQLVDMEANLDKVQLPENNIINASYLGVTVLELLNLEGASSFFDFNMDLRKNLPVISHQGFMDADGNLLDTVPKDLEEDIERLDSWVYYKIFEEEIKLKDGDIIMQQAVEHLTNNTATNS